MGLGERPARRHVPTAQGRGHWGGERPTPLWEPGGPVPPPRDHALLSAEYSDPANPGFPTSARSPRPFHVPPQLHNVSLCLGAPSAVGQTPTASRLWESCRGTL